MSSVFTISNIACAWLVPDWILGRAASDFSRITSIKESTTESATSDSSSADRISAQVFSISEVDILPRERSEEKAPVNLADSESNIEGDLTPELPIIYRLLPVPVTALILHRRFRLHIKYRSLRRQEL